MSKYYYKLENQQIKFIASTALYFNCQKTQTRILKFDLSEQKEKNSLNRSQIKKRSQCQAWGTARRLMTGLVFVLDRFSS